MPAGRVVAWFQGEEEEEEEEGCAHRETETEGGEKKRQPFSLVGVVGK